MVRLTSKTLTKLAVIAVALLGLLGVGLTFPRASARQSQEPVNVVPFGSPVADKLGINDGAALIIHFTGDIHGDLDACS